MKIRRVWLFMAIFAKSNVWLWLKLIIMKIYYNNDVRGRIGVRMMKSRKGLFVSWMVMFWFVFGFFVWADEVFLWLVLFFFCLECLMGWNEELMKWVMCVKEYIKCASIFAFLFFFIFWIDIFVLAWWLWLLMILEWNGSFSWMLLCYVVRFVESSCIFDVWKYGKKTSEKAKNIHRLVFFSVI